MKFLKISHNQGETYLILDKIISFERTGSISITIDTLGDEYEFDFETPMQRNHTFRQLISCVIKEGKKYGTRS